MSKRGKRPRRRRKYFFGVDRAKPGTERYSNVIVTIDGKPLDGITNLRFEHQPVLANPLPWPPIQAHYEAEANITMTGQMQDGFMEMMGVLVPLRCHVVLDGAPSANPGWLPEQTVLGEQRRLTEQMFDTMFPDRAEGEDLRRIAQALGVDETGTLTPEQIRDASSRRR